MLRILRPAAWLAAVLVFASCVAAAAFASGPSIPLGAVRHGAQGDVRTSAPTAPASTLAPARGQIFTGVSSGSAAQFAAQVGKHPAVYGEFVNWGQSIHFAFNDAANAHARLMLHIATGQASGGRAPISPQQIAEGDGDGYLLTLSALIAEHGKPVYIRLMPEMNNAANAACSVNADGSSRGPAYSPAEFIAAWRRVVVVLRGGSVGAIDDRLAALGLPPLHASTADGKVARSPISFVWTPETAGTPNIPANSAATYYPGNAYVDWVGTDFYSKFPNFPGLNAFYKEFPNKPFAFSEWAIWGGDDPGFVSQLFAWVGKHKRVQMMLYNQGYITNGPFSLNLDPLSTAVIRTLIRPRQFLALTPDW
jgi:hypothetical protein